MGFRTAGFDDIGRRALAAMLLATTAAGMGMAVAQAQAASSRSVWSAPAGPLNRALAVFGSQSGTQLSYDASIVRGKTTGGVKGATTRQQAIAQLLRGTGLSYSFTDATSVVISAPAAASGGAATEAGAITLDTINVQGAGDGANGYVATRSVGGTKTDTPLIETPASVSVVTNQQIRDQNAKSIAQALRYTPGIVAEQRGVNETSLEYLYSRGFQANTYLDGLLVPFTGFNISTRDAFLIDHIESIKGPASVLYGQTPPGGVIDVVSKQPLETPYHEVFVETGNHKRAEAGFDFSGPVGGRDDLFYRLTAVGLTTETQTDFVDQKRIAIAPSFTYKPDEDTKLTVTANYQRDPDAGAFNYVPAVGTVLPGVVDIPRSFNTGDPGFDTYKKTEASVGYAFEHRFNDVWQVKQNFRYLYNDQQIKHVGDGSALDASGTALNRIAYNNFGTVNAATLDNQAIATFDTGPLEHKALFGFDYQNIQYNHRLYYGGITDPASPPLSILDPIYYQTIPTPTFLLGTSNKTRTSQEGVYAQDQIKFGQATFVASLRQDWAQTHVVSYKNGAVTDEDANALTGRVGLIYNFDNGLAPYVSYSTSFQPQSGATDTGAPLAPTKGKQIEVGLKYQPVGMDSYLTASLFDLRQTNVTVSNTLYPGSITQTGEVRSRGFEFEAHAFLTDDLQAIASYTYNDVVNTRATASIQDKSPAGIPSNMASLWLSYDLPDHVAPGLTIMGGARFVGDSYGDAINSFKAPSFTLFDAGLRYDFSKSFPNAKGLSANLNVSNLFDKTYVTCTGLTYCTYGEGRSVFANMNYKW